MSHPEWGPNHLAHHQLVPRETRWSTEWHWQRTEKQDLSAHIHRCSARDTQAQTTLGQVNTLLHTDAHTRASGTQANLHTAHSTCLPNTHTHKYRTT